MRHQTSRGLSIISAQTPCRLIIFSSRFPSLPALAGNLKGTNMSIFKKAARWAGRRATEGSTVTGIAIVIGGILAPKLGLPLDQTTHILTSIIGAGLAAATTKTHPPLHEQI